MAIIEKLTNIANAIRSKTGKTDSLTLDEMPTEIEAISGGGGYTTEENEYGETVKIGDGTSGDLPKLFDPVVTTGMNTVSWANDPQNGGFLVTVTATIDDVEATSPLIITEQMDGKILVITATCDGFQTSITEIEIHYTERLPNGVTLKRNRVRVRTSDTYFPFAELTSTSSSRLIGLTTNNLIEYDDGTGVRVNNSRNVMLENINAINGSTVTVTFEGVTVSKVITSGNSITFNWADFGFTIYQFSGYYSEYSLLIDIEEPV